MVSGCGLKVVMVLVSLDAGISDDLWAAARHRGLITASLCLELASDLSSEGSHIAVRCFKEQPELASLECGGSVAGPNSKPDMISSAHCRALS